MQSLVAVVTGSLLRSVIAICFLTFAFAAYIGSTNWWLSKSPWNSTTKDGFMNVPYHALIDRQPTSKPTGYPTPTIMAPYYTFKVLTSSSSRAAQKAVHQRADCWASNPFDSCCKYFNNCSTLLVLLYIDAKVLALDCSFFFSI